MPDASHPDQLRSESAELTDRADLPSRSSKRASTGPLGNLAALGVLVIAAVSLLVLLPRSEETPSTGAIPSSSPQTSQLPSLTATSSATPEPTGSAASTTPPFVRHEGLQAELASIPPDAPATISEAEAIAIALDHMNVARFVEPIIVEHGCRADSGRADGNCLACGHADPRGVAVPCRADLPQNGRVLPLDGRRLRWRARLGPDRPGRTLVHGRSSCQRSA